MADAMRRALRREMPDVAATAAELRPRRSGLHGVAARAAELIAERHRRVALRAGPRVSQLAVGRRRAAAAARGRAGGLCAGLVRGRVAARGGLLELAQAVADCFPQLRKLARPEDEKDDHQYDNEVAWLKRSGSHTVCLVE